MMYPFTVSKEMMEWIMLPQTMMMFDLKQSKIS